MLTVTYSPMEERPCTARRPRLPDEQEAVEEWERWWANDQQLTPEEEHALEPLTPSTALVSAEEGGAGSPLSDETGPCTDGSSEDLEPKLPEQQTTQQLEGGDFDGAWRARDCGQVVGYFGTQGEVAHALLAGDGAGRETCGRGCWARSGRGDARQQ